MLLACGALHQARGQANRRPLSSADVEDIAKLEMLEDRRQFDSTELARILAAPHPELRRRAAISIARINDKRGTALLRSRALDADTAVAASVVFAVGQLRDTLAVAFLDSLLSDSRTPPTMATEAAAGLGKIRSVPARMALERYLARAAANERTTETIGEALLAVGRVTQRGDIRPIVKWSTSPDEELRWRAAWSLFRPRDPAAVATLITLGSDQSALVRSWAVRGLARPQADSVGLGPKAEALLIAAARDIDRRVRTEALRALGTYSDSLVVNALLAGLRSADSWISVSASEGMARVKAPATITSLVLTATGAPSCTIRLAAMQALFAFSMPDAVQGAIGALHHPSPYCRLTALQALARDTTDIPARAIGRAAVDAFLQDRLLALRSQAWLSHWTILDSELDATARRTARRIDVLSPDHVQRAASLRAMVQWADTTDLPLLLDLYARAVKDTAGGVASSSVAVIAAIQR
ncbi:MAG: peptidyl-prolyl cis-trans isomerase cyclophilin type, partial [Gemmatimonadetes bacterium]|nr:peptidyl-prolyl cis-trans isomerase cyclophilin type [Gemmatimonadota bacterium]